ncbi:FecR family protein [Roseivirga sp. E12]|uniref:FecR family protein n=1 Tax=Roseivirga sp. E12 TaxID=2819237 RepID=UPI001ABBED27|nr:FecR domain-containing protein [Roseivirga sp. E12]MBO3697192.1 FecR domain-containing protein [Roseivirga sp. E12]
MADKINDSEDFLARWLSGELSPEEQREFESSEEGIAFSKIVESTDKLAMPQYDVETELAKLKDRRSQEAPTETKVIRLGGFFKYAAAAVVVIGISLIYYLTLPNYTVYETLAGQIETITLPDQSIVTLNANSKLRFDPDEFGENRHLLLTGEAFFEVTKGINFEVETDQGTVKVLGTSFNVWNRNNLLDVVCYTGKVNVSEQEFSQDLIPGDGVRIDNGSFKRSWKKQLNDGKPVWITSGVTELENVTLKEALNELSNVFGIDIKSTPEIDIIPFTGNFPNDDVIAAIKLVLRADNIEYQYDSTNQKLVLSGIKGQ